MANGAATVTRLVGGAADREPPGAREMDFTEQMATKLLAHAIRQLGQAVNETLCVTPDKAMIRGMLKDIRGTLEEFEDAYFDESQ